MTDVFLCLVTSFFIAFILVAPLVAYDLAKISQALTRIADSLEPRAFLEPKR
jgi:hypothetical protein